MLTIVGHQSPKQILFGLLAAPAIGIIGAAIAVIRTIAAILAPVMAPMAVIFVMISVRAVLVSSPGHIRVAAGSGESRHGKSRSHKNGGQSGSGDFRG